MKKTEIILSEIAEGDPIKVLNILKENKNSKLKYQCSYEDHLFQLKSDKESEVDGPFSYIDDVIEYNKDVNSLSPENNKYESVVDVFNNWETPELETYAGGNFNSKKPVYWGDCLICATGCLDIEDLILKLSEFISSEDEEDEEFRDEGFYWFLDSLDIISDPEEFHVGFEDNDIRVNNINYSVGTELGINNISFYSTNNMVHSDYEFMIEILNQSNEKDMVSKNDEIENITEEPKVNSNMKKSTYDNGNILEEWEVNEKGQRHGLMKRYHENGQLQVEVTWTNGIQDDSEIISYHDDGSKARQVTRVNSSLNGEFFEWHKNGQLKKQGVYNENVPTIQKEWDEIGDLINELDEDKVQEDEDSLETFKIFILTEGTEFFYKNENGENLSFVAEALAVECNYEDLEGEIMQEIGGLILTSKGENFEPHLVTDLPDIFEQEFSNGTGSLNNEAFTSIQEVVDFIKNLKSISFKTIDPKDGESIRYID